MSLHYTDKRVTLHLGDCVAVMSSLEENSVDAIVTDPPYELGFMGKSWDSSGIAFSVETWRQALRVLKPGGHLIAFSGSRTYHRMAVAIEDAGFEIRDQILWLYGSGFPKSMDVSKAIDKAAGAEREDVYETKARVMDNEVYGNGVGVGIVERRPVTDAAKQWQGWGTALKPAHEPMVLARKALIGTVAANVLAHGTGGLNIDASRVGSEGGTRLEVTDKDKGLFAPGTGSLSRGYGDVVDGLGRWPANVIHDGSDEVVAGFPDTGKSGVAVNRNRSGEKPGEVFNGGWGNLTEDVGFGDSGSAARFFYCAKTSKRDRNEGDVVNFHPTVKPTALMEYLIKLVTPTGGTVLDPFMGSGSTGKAAMHAGFNFIGIDMTPEYVDIAKARIAYAQRDTETIEEVVFPKEFARPEIVDEATPLTLDMDGAL